MIVRESQTFSNLVTNTESLCTTVWCKFAFFDIQLHSIATSMNKMNLNKFDEAHTLAYDQSM